MLLKDWLSKWNVKLKLNLGVVEAELEFTDLDKDAAWELYTELVTRVTSQPLDADEGDPTTALTSVYSIFDTTRTIMKEKGRKASGFAHIAVIVLNKVIRPFTRKWHKISLDGGFEDEANRDQFRTELKTLQVLIGDYTKSLAEMAGVEDMTQIIDE